MNTPKVLSAIKDMNSRQKDTSKPIGVDTLCLVLRMTPADLMPLIDELIMCREITLHPNPVKNASSANRLGGVSLN